MDVGFWDIIVVGLKTGLGFNDSRVKLARAI